MKLQNWIKCKKVPKQYSEKEKPEVMKRLAEAARIFESDPVLRRHGWNKDGQIFEDMFIEAVDKNPNFHYIYKKDVGVFKDWLNTRSKLIDKDFGMKHPQFMRWKVLETKLSPIPGGKEVAKQLKESVAFQRRHIDMNKENIETIRSSTEKIAKEFGIKTIELAKLEADYMKAPTEEARDIAEAAIKKHLGSATNLKTREMAGDLAYGIMDIMEGGDISSLKHSQGKENWTPEQQKHARKIKKAWIDIRKDMLNVLINGLKMEKATARKMDEIEGGSRGLSRHLEFIDAKIKELEVNEKKPDIGPEYDLTGKETRDLGIFSESTFQLNAEKGYVPHHMLRMTEHLKEFNSFMHGNETISAGEKFKEVMDFYNQAGSLDRLATRRSLNEEGYSKNPFMFLNKYVKDISKYNYDSRAKFILADAYKTLMRSKEFAEGSPSQFKVDETIDAGLKMLSSLQEQALLLGERGGSEFIDKGSRLLTSAGFIRAMAGSYFRVPGKNLAGGSLMAWMELGYVRDIQARNYLDKNLDVKNAADKWLAEYGLLWTRDSSLIQNLKEVYARGPHVSAATKGALEEGFLPPGLKEIKYKDKSGKEQTGITVSDTALLDKTLGVVEKVAGVGAFFNQIVENILRPTVFRAAFSNSHRNLMDMPPSFIQKQLGREFNPKMSAAEKQKLIFNWATRQAGREAIDAVNLTQFEYADVSKADILSDHKVIGQFQHYKFELINWRQKALRDGWRQIKNAVKTGEFNTITPFAKRIGMKEAPGEYQVQKAQRMGIGLALSSAFTMMSGYGLYNWFAPEDLHMFKNMYTALTADTDTQEGQDALAQATFGGGLGGTVGGISFNTFMEWAKLMQFIKVNPEDKLFMAGIDEGEYLSLDNEEYRYRMIRMFNSQAARIYKYTYPDMMDGYTGRALLTELGLHLDYDSRKKREDMLRQVNQFAGREFRAGRSKPKSKSTEELYADALSSLSAFS